MDKSLIEIFSENDGKISDKWSGYLNFYNHRFEYFKDKINSLLEIGVQNGGTIELWAKYFKNADYLIGIDIDENISNIEFFDQRISVHVGDASKKVIADSIFEKYPSGFDLIIDDGSHTSKDIISSFGYFFDQLNLNGLYVVEDLHCSYWKEWGGGVLHPYSSLAFFKKIVDVINHEHWGIESTRLKLIADFNKEYNISINENLLNKIYSIEFLNSICVIRKKSEADCAIGDRYVTGSREEKLAYEKNANSRCVAPNQIINKYSDIKVFGGKNFFDILDELNKVKEKFEVEVINNKNIKIELTKISDRVKGIESSNSWRITQPLRAFSSGIKNMKIILNKIKRKGGVLKSFKFAIAVLTVEGPSGIKSRLLGYKKTEPALNSKSYQVWIGENETIEAEKALIDELNSMTYKPLISIIMPVFNPPIIYLKEAVKSLDNQIYENWELCLADDASTDLEVKEYLEYLSSHHPKVKVFFRAKNGHISAASNTALSLASGEFVGLMDNDDALHKTALGYVVKAINFKPGVHFIYSDEDKMNEKGIRYDPHFKADFNYELLLAQNMISHFGVYRRSIVESIDGFREGLEGAQDWDLTLRFIDKINWSCEIIHIQKILYHWRAISGSTALTVHEKPYIRAAQKKAVNDHFLRNKIAAQAEFINESFPFLRAKFHVEEDQNKVSIIIPTKDNVELLRKCVNSIVEKTIYKNYELIVVDNNSSEAATIEYFDELRSTGIIVIDAPIPFNYSKLNNLAIPYSSGNILCLMNNDIEIIDGDWMREMVSFAARPEIGCVGAKLLYPSGKVQHAGVVLGIGGVAGHAMIGIDDADYGYFGRASVHQSYSAVTAACLMIKSDIYKQLNGLDEELAVAFNDVDFCIRVREAGFRNIWTPFAKMYHHESASRGAEDNPVKLARFNNEIEIMKKKWGEILLNDPAYNPNLSLTYHAGFVLK